MLETLNLGSFSLKTRSDDDDVNVSTAVSATATLSHDGSTNLQHLLGKSIADAQSRHTSVWVRQTSVLGLKLHVHVNGCRLHSQEEQRIREMITNAKVSCISFPSKPCLTVIAAMESIAS